MLSKQIFHFTHRTFNHGLVYVATPTFLCDNFRGENTEGKKTRLIFGLIRHLAWNLDRWVLPVNTVMNLRRPKTAGQVWTSTVARRTCCMELMMLLNHNATAPTAWRLETAVRGTRRPAENYQLCLMNAVMSHHAPCLLVINLSDPDPSSRFQGIKIALEYRTCHALRTDMRRIQFCFYPEITAITNMKYVGQGSMHTEWLGNPPHWLAKLPTLQPCKTSVLRVQPHYPND
jgi:hypothetical protein